MKKAALFSILLCLALLAGCRSAGFRLQAEEIRQVEVYTGGVPAAAEKKTVTGEEDIRRIASLVNGLLLLGEASEEDVEAGGIGLYLQIIFTSGEEQRIRLPGDDLLLQEGKLYRTNGLNGTDLWESLDYEAVLVGEEGLPQG